MRTSSKSIAAFGALVLVIATATDVRAQLNTQHVKGSVGLKDKPALQTWIIGPVLKMVGDFEASTKKYPLIPMGTPDPYKPPSQTR